MSSWMCCLRGSRGREKLKNEYWKHPQTREGKGDFTKRGKYSEK